MLPIGKDKNSITKPTVGHRDLSISACGDFVSLKISIRFYTYIKLGRRK